MKKITLLILALFLSLSGYSQVFQEGFESSNLPDTATDTWNLGTANLGSDGIWGVFDNGVGLAQSWNVNTTPANVYEGAKAAYMNRENIGIGNTARDYLATPRITIPANGQLRFFTRTTINGDQGTKYKIMVAPSPDAAPVAQNDPANYVQVQQWTESTLTTTFNVYEEKHVDLSAYAGQKVYIAFVMEFTQPTAALGGDRWLVDLVRVGEKCADPTGGTATVTETTANLSWDANGATQWELEILPFTGTFTGLNTITTSASSYLATATTTPVAPFTNSTQYKYYVRATCGNGFTSDWAGPYSFSTSSPGLTCSSPIVIPPGVPYSTTDTTANYGDTTDTPQPAACAGTATNYMTGNDVFYSYTPTTSAAISITMTPTGNWSGIFVYDGCANVGVNCVAGVANSGSGVRDIPSLNVIAGHQYIIVISTNATPQTVGYTMIIQTLNCPSPTNLTATATGQNAGVFTANLSWDNPGGATSWQVFVQPFGASIPTTSGDTATTNVNFPVDHLTGTTTSLALGQYQYWVRADCGDGTFSTWAGPYVFATTTCNTGCTYKFIQTDGFGDGWNGGTMVVSQSGVPVITLTGPTAAQGQTPVTVNVALCPGPFELTWNNAGTFPGEIGISIVNSFNQTLFVKAAGTGTAGTTPIYVGTVDCTTPACLPPTLVTAANPTTHEVDLTWTPNGSNVPVSWEIFAVPTGSPVPDASTVPTVSIAGTTPQPYTITGLLADTSYTFYIRAVCTAGGSNPWSPASNPITTLPTCPRPTAITFSGVTVTQAGVSWTPGGSETSWQIVVVASGAPAPAAGDPSWVTVTSPSYTILNLSAGTAYDVYVKAICSDTDSSTPAGPIHLTTPPGCGGSYFDNGGTSADYSVNSDDIVTICPNNPGDVVTVTFTSFSTEATWDALYVFDGNSINAPQIPSANGAGNVPGGLAGGYWGATIPGPFTSSSADGCLTFRFRSDGSVTDPGWVANITCAPGPTCPKPGNVTTSNITDHQATITWTAGGSETTWQVIAVANGSPVPADTDPNWITTTNNPYTFTGLTPGTDYDIYVRAICSATDSSIPRGPIDVKTPPGCGGGFFDNGGATANYTNNANDTITICPENPGDAVTVTFTSFDTEANWDALYVFDGSSTSAPLIASDNPANNVPGGLAGGYWGSTVPGPFTSSSPDGCLTFQFRSDGSGNFAGWTASVSCAPAPTCSRPNLLTVTQIGQTSALLGWTQPANPNGPPPTQWEIIVVPFGSPVPDQSATGTIVTINPILYTGLTPGTQYSFYVRAICSDDTHTLWSSASNFSTLPANDECSGAIYVPVNSNSTCNQTVSGTLAGATASAQASTCPGTADDDIWYQFVASNSYLNVTLYNIAGSTTNLNYAVYAGTCGGLTLVQCSTANTTALTGLTIGTTYYIRIWSTDSGPQTSSFDICISTPSSCGTASYACSTEQYTNTTQIPNIGQVGCLFTAPNPRFFVVSIATSGPINYLITQGTVANTANLDVDFAAWGPFTDTLAACNFINTPTGTGEPLAAPTAGCSYSAAPTENWNIPSATAGSYYVLLVTNFSNQPGIINLNQTNAGQPSAGTVFCCEEPNFNYPAVAYCTVGNANPTAIIAPGSAAGIFTASPAGLVFADSATGQIDLAASQPGTYIITNTLAATGQCPVRHFDYTLTISSPPVATISYPQPAYCQNDPATVNVTLTGTSGGFYSSQPIGLFINPNTGAITPSSSTPGIYTVSYTLLNGGACTANSPSTQIEIIALPTLAPVADVTNCGPYTLPALTVGSYYSAANGVGLIDPTIPLTQSQTVFVYAANGTCSSQLSFQVSIDSAPVLDPVGPVSSCANYVLPHLNVGDYYSAPGGPTGSGTLMHEGDVISSNQTIYIYASNGTCVSETSFTVTIGNITADILNDVIVCDSYDLPALSANNSYYTASGGPSGGGTLITLPASITTSQTVYIYAGSGACSDQSSFVVTVNHTPDVLPVAAVSQCDSYALGVPAVGHYYSAADGGGTLLDNTTLTSSQTVWVYAQTGTTPNCFDQESFAVSITPSPVVVDMDDVSPCESYTLPAVTVGGYFTGPNGTGSQLQAGQVLTTSQTVYIYAASGSCSDQDSFAVNIVTPPAFTIDSGCQGANYMLSVVPATGSFDPQTAHYAWSVTGGGAIPGASDTQSVVISGAGDYTVMVSVGACDHSETVSVDGTGCTIQKGISPNGDGWNDYFDLEGQNVTKLEIFNRYGTIVYTKRNYTIQWHGQTDSGDELPDGTYYYVIERSAGQAKTGWIYINRERN